MKNSNLYFILLLILAIFTQCEPLKTTKETVATAPYKLVWADEFDKDGMPDSLKWGYSIGDGCPNLCGWGNNEKQYYTEKRLENARVENGHLIIETRKEVFGQSTYSSAKLISKGKGDFKYGKIEARAKLPSGRGIWPAIWMLPSTKEYGGWPRSGEIDIMEFVGFNPDSIHGTVHTEAYNHMHGTQKGGAKLGDDYESAFHVYGIEWTADKIDFLLDGAVYFQFKNERNSSSQWPFDQEFYLILNTAVGGFWGGREGVDDSIFPQQLVIDYVRVYQN